MEDEDDKVEEVEEEEQAKMEEELKKELDEEQERVKEEEEARRKEEEEERRRLEEEEEEENMRLENLLHISHICRLKNISHYFAYLQVGDNFTTLEICHDLRDQWLCKIFPVV